MKKKYLWSLLTMIMVTMLTGGFMSCSSDNDDDDGSFKSSDLVGTWKRVGRGAFYTFYSDGTLEGSTTYSNWKYSDGRLDMTRRNSGRIETWYVEYKDNLLYLTLPDGEATERKVWEKINLENTLHLTKEYFVGKWNEGSSDAWDFFADGRCEFEISWAVGNGSWSFDEETQTLKTATTYHSVSAAGKTISTDRNEEWKIIYATDDEWAGDGFSFMRVK